VPHTLLDGNTSQVCAGQYSMSWCCELVVGDVLIVFTGCGSLLWVTDGSCTRCIYRLWVNIMS